MAKTPVHVTVTGAAGQIGYSILFRIASGQLLGPDQPVVLRLLEIEPAMKALNGVAMELDDCAFPLLAGHRADGGSDDRVLGHELGAAGRRDAAQGRDGARRPAQRQRRDLQAAGPGDQLHAADDVRVLVVGNPCNTNCLIARSNAPDVPADRWFAMTRLDENRAQVAARAEGRRAGRRRDEHGDLGQPLGHAVSRLRQREDRRQAGDRGDRPTTTGCGRLSSRPCRSAARRSSRRAGCRRRRRRRTPRSIR